MKMIDYGCDDKIKELDSFIIALQKENEALTLELEHIKEVYERLLNEK